MCILRGRFRLYDVWYNIAAVAAAATPVRSGDADIDFERSSVSPAATIDFSARRLTSDDAAPVTPVSQPAPAGSRLEDAKALKDPRRPAGRRAGGPASRRATVTFLIRDKPNAYMQYLIH